jgi:hypothetical protein
VDARSIGGTIPISLRHWSRYVRTGSSSSNYFGIFQLGWAPNPFVPFQHAPMGCNVHVTTRGWIQLIGTIPFFETLEPLLYVFQLQLFLVSFNWMGPNLWFLFSMLNGLYYMCYSWMNSTRSIGGTITSWHIGAVDACRLFQLNYFWYLSTRMGLTLCSFQHAPMGWRTCDYSWMNSTQ